MVRPPARHNRVPVPSQSVSDYITTKNNDCFLNLAKTWDCISLTSSRPIWAVMFSWHLWDLSRRGNLRKIVQANILEGIFPGEFACGRYV